MHSGGWSEAACPSDDRQLGTCLLHAELHRLVPLKKAVENGALIA